jgi:hypothetical protein
MPVTTAPHALAICTAKKLLERSFALVKGNGAEFSAQFYATLFLDRQWT